MAKSSTSSKSGSSSTKNSSSKTNSTAKTVAKNVQTSTSKKTTKETASSDSNTTSGSNTVSDSVSNSYSTTHGVSKASGQVDELTQQKRTEAMQDYQKSDAVKAAYDQLQSKLNNEPEVFSSDYKNTLNELYSKIADRDPFSYDVNADAMYRTYKEIYEQQGKKAMTDTMAQAAGLTGGYGSSYAQSAGQQQYQNYLDELNDRIPELRQQAFQEYQAEGDQLQNQFNLANALYGNEFQEHRADVADYQADRSFLQGQYQDERNFDYNQYAQNRQFWNDEYWNERNAEHTTDSTTEGTETTHGVSSTSGWSNTHTDSQAKKVETAKSKDVSKSTSTTNSSSTTNSNETSNTSSWSNSSSASSGSGGSSKSSTKDAAQSKRTNASKQGTKEYKGVINYLADIARQYNKSSDAEYYRRQALQDFIDNGDITEADADYFMKLFGYTK